MDSDENRTSDPASKRPGRHDQNGHPMSAWDKHFACRSCLRSVGQHCSRATPYTVCAEWTEKMWTAAEDAERRSEIKRLARQRRREAKVKEQVSSTLMPPPLGVPKKSHTPSARRRDRSMGEDAEWSPVEAPPSGASAPPSPWRMERPSLQDSAQRVPRSKAAGTYAESTPKSARTAKAVKADLESSRPAQAVMQGGLSCGLG